MSPNTTLPTESSPSLYVIDPHIVDLVLTVQIFICGTAGLFGILGNFINILVFYKQGYSVNITLTALAVNITLTALAVNITLTALAVNITLTALAVSDTGALVTLQVFYLLMNPWFLKADLDLNPTDLSMIISFYPHNYFIRVCGFITAYASLERCVCVVSPLKVKRIFTNKTAIVTVILIFAITTLDLFPLYYTIYLDWGFSPSLNKSILHIMYRQIPYMVFNISYYINDLMAPYTTFFIILMSTAIISIKLKQQARWRQSMSHVKTETHISSKESKTVVMLSTISIVFIVCLIPQSTILTVVIFVPDISYGGRYFYLALMGYCVSYLSDTALSSVNILVYLRMSHKYREQFFSIFSRKKII